MRRGLISWSPEEMPISTLQARVARLQQAMQQHGLGAVLVHTSFAHPSAVHWLTNFTPYWSEALLVVLPHGTPVLLAALTQRVHPWIREVSHLGDVKTAPRLGVAAAAYLDEHLAPAAQVGVVALDDLPWSTAEPLLATAWGSRLVDASDIFRALRQPADLDELRLAARAERMAYDALDARPPDATHSSAWASAIESRARLDGAEELLQRMAPDLGRGATLQRLEGDFALGARRAVELALAYKGAWVRVTRMDCAGPRPSGWQAAEAWFDRAWRGMQAPQPGLDPSDPPPGALVQWSLQSCTGAEPLQVVAASAGCADRPMAAHALAVLCVQLALPDGPWFASQMLVLGAGGTQRSRSLQDATRA